MSTQLSHQKKKQKKQNILDVNNYFDFILEPQFIPLLFDEFRYQSDGGKTLSKVLCC